MDSIQLRFSLSNVYEGFATGNGIATADSAGLTLEFELKDGIVGVLRSGIRNIHIPVGELYAVALKLGWFRTRLSITTRSMKTLDGIPGNDGGKVELCIARKDRKAAAGLVSILMLSLSEKELAKLGRQ